MYTNRLCSLFYREGVVVEHHSTFLSLKSTLFSVDSRRTAFKDRKRLAMERKVNLTYALASH